MTVINACHTVIQHGSFNLIDNKINAYSLPGITTLLLKQCNNAFP